VTPILVLDHCRWVLWVSLAIMLGDSVTSLSLLVITSSRTYLRNRRRQATVGLTLAMWPAADGVQCYATPQPAAGIN
jgi:hypothetical protein